MIIVQDRMTVTAANLGPLRELIAQHYRPEAAARGLEWIGDSVSPPLALSGNPLTLYIRWKLDHVGLFWQARAMSATPSVTAFWDRVDEITLSRERQYLTPGDNVLAQPEPVANVLVIPEFWRETAQLFLRNGEDASGRARLHEVFAAARSEISGLIDVSFAENYTADFGGGHFTLDLMYGSESEAVNARAGSWWQSIVLPVLDETCEQVSALGLRTIGAGTREPSLASPIKRTALFRSLPNVGEETLEKFAMDTLEMPAFIASIKNWRLSEAISLDWDTTPSPWTYVWEQEFENLDGLNIDYMIHPHHWALVDRWFDIESGDQIVDANLCHAFATMTESYINK